MAPTRTLCVRALLLLLILAACGSSSAPASHPGLWKSEALPHLLTDSPESILTRTAAEHSVASELDSLLDRLYLEESTPVRSRRARKVERVAPVPIHVYRDADGNLVETAEEVTVTDAPLGVPSADELDALYDEGFAVRKRVSKTSHTGEDIDNSGPVHIHVDEAGSLHETAASELPTPADHYPLEVNSTSDLASMLDALFMETAPVRTRKVTKKVPKRVAPAAIHLPPSRLRTAAVRLPGKGLLHSSIFSTKTLSS